MDQETAIPRCRKDWARQIELSTFSPALRKLMLLDRLLDIYAASLEVDELSLDIYAASFEINGLPFDVYAALIEINDPVVRYLRRIVRGLRRIVRDQ